MRQHSALPRSFYDRDTRIVAKALIGCVLEHKTEKGIIAGRISETEAYMTGDPAAHSFKGKTPRNAAVFGPPGHAYVYFTYGMHYCFNAVTRKEGLGEAVLIRALEPLSGISAMEQHRGTKDLHNLCSGPAKLVQALAIGRDDNGRDLTKGNLRILPSGSYPGWKKQKINATPRIGISKAVDKKWRYVVEQKRKKKY